MTSNGVNETKEATLRKEVLYKMGCLKTIFSTPDGKKALELLEETFFNNSSIVPGDSYATHAREGAREVVIFIRENIKDGN